MARNEQDITQNIDWLTVLIYAACVTMGLFNVYAAIYDPEEQTKLFDLSNSLYQSLYHSFWSHYKLQLGFWRWFYRNRFISRASIYCTGHISSSIVSSRFFWM